ncbi:MAG: alpha/beta hydrolase [Planctomycetota bacterium]
MPQEVQVQVDGVKIAAEVAGEGVPVVLLHGFPLSRRMWDRQVEALRKSCCVIAVDLRGFGESGLAPSDAESGVPMERYAVDVAALLDGIGVDEPVVLAGFSMGGYIAWQFALRYPERLRGLLAIDTRAVADTDEARSVRLKMAESIQRLGLDPVVQAMTPKLFAAASITERPEAVAEVQEILRSSSPAAVAAAQRGMAARPDVTGRLAEMNVSALVVCGAEDAISPPEEMRSIAETLPHAEYVEIAGAGHMTTAEAPEEVSRAMTDFIAGL